MREEAAEWLWNNYSNRGVPRMSSIQFPFSKMQLWCIQVWLFSNKLVTVDTSSSCCVFRLIFLRLDDIWLVRLKYFDVRYVHAHIRKRCEYYEWQYMLSYLWHDAFAAKCNICIHTTCPRQIKQPTSTILEFQNWDEVKLFSYDSQSQSIWITIDISIYNVYTVCKNVFWTKFNK